MNTDDPHLKCHLMSQVILHICPHHHVIVLNFRCRRSCHNANENLRNDGSKTQTSHMKVPPGYAVVDCGSAKSLCGAKPVALMAQTCAREGKRFGDERDTEAIDESCHFRGIGNQIVNSFMKLRVLGSIDEIEVIFAPSVTPGDILPLVGNDHLIPCGCSIHLYPDECRLEIPARGIDAKLLAMQILQAWKSLIMMCGTRNEEETVKRQVPRVT